MPTCSIWNSEQGNMKHDGECENKDNTSKTHDNTRFTAPYQ